MTFPTIAAILKLYSMAIRHILTNQVTSFRLGLVRAVIKAVKR